ncbi:MAG: hypothetical protein NT178_14945 [Proteobacteria bacterium]|nr:hypothetical protein [Pseudomonadota bacterium]
MAMKWNLESDINNKTMEEVLIEIFGCTSPDKRVAKIHSISRIKGIETEFYLAGNAMETMLIEIFGCSSLVDGNAIKLEIGKDIRRINREPFPDWNADDRDTMPLTVNA